MNAASFEIESTQKKPPLPYAELITLAIQNSPDQKITLNEIYNYVLENFPYFRSAGAGWKNSVRHNLSLNRHFVRVPRPANEKGKGAYWTFNATGSAKKKRVVKQKAKVVKQESTASYFDFFPGINTFENIPMFPSNVGLYRSDSENSMFFDFDQSLQSTTTNVSPDVYTNLSLDNFDHSHFSHDIFQWFENANHRVESCDPLNTFFPVGDSGETSSSSTFANHWSIQ